MKLISCIFLCFWLALRLTTQAQEKPKKDLYFQLDSTAISYYKKIYFRNSTYSKSQFELNSFGIRCDCHISGTLSFSGHTNKDVGNTSEPAKVISNAIYKKLKFISFDQLVELLQQHDLGFNDIYNLYFVEHCKKEKRKYTVYNVKFRNTFIDNQ